MELIGKSRGGNTTKIHVAVNNNGIPLKILLSKGSNHDIKFAKPLIENLDVKTTVADRGYDSNWFRSSIINPCI